jgi:hypothetical protein
MCLHLVEGEALFGGQELAQILFHLLLDGLYLGEALAPDGFELGTDKLLGHGHDHDLRLHPAGVGFVVPKAKRYRWLHPDPAP